MAELNGVATGGGAAADSSAPRSRAGAGAARRCHVLRAQVEQRHVLPVFQDDGRQRRIVGGGWRHERTGAACTCVGLMGGGEGGSFGLSCTMGQAAPGVCGSVGNPRDPAKVGGSVLAPG